MAVYAAYGSNMDPGQMALRAPHSPLRGMLDALDAPRQLPGLQTG